MAAGIGPVDVVLRRIAGVADGWIPMTGATPEIQAQRHRTYAYADAAGRTADDIGIHVEAWDGTDLVDRLGPWEELGADHLSAHTMGADRDPEAHVEVIGTVAEELANAGIELGG